MEASRPLVTLALSTWNHARYVEDALRAAFAQDYSPLEIIISDDASTDATFDIISKLAGEYYGPHKIRLNRNDRNLGVGSHCDLLMQMARGDIVVLAAGDDISESDRVTRIVEAWGAEPEAIFCISSSALVIDEFGHKQELVPPWTFEGPIDAVKIAETGSGLLGATLAVHRHLLHAFGPMGESVRTCEDIILPFRAALLGRLANIEAPLVRYRRHSNGLMGGIVVDVTSREKFVSGLERMYRGSLAARRIQIQDLKSAWNKVADQQRLLGALQTHLKRNEVVVALLDRRRGAFWQLMKLVREGVLPKKEAAKAALMARAPKLWFRYVSWRYRRIANRDIP